MGLYAGISNVARKVKSAYIGVDGKARKIKKMYIGVGGVARLFYSAGCDLPTNISGSFTGNKNTVTIVTTVTLEAACTVTIKLTNINILGGSSNKVSQMGIGDVVASDSSVSNHPSTLTATGSLAAGTYDVTVLCFGVTGGQSGTTYYSGSMDYEITFS